MAEVPAEGYYYGGEGYENSPAQYYHDDRREEYQSDGSYPNSPQGYANAAQVPQSPQDPNSPFFGESFNPSNPMAGMAVNYGAQMMGQQFGNVQGHVGEQAIFASLHSSH